MTSSWGQKDKKQKRWAKDCVYEVTWSKEGYCCNKCKIEGKGAHGSICDRKDIEQSEAPRISKMFKDDQEKTPWRKEAEKKENMTLSEPKKSKGDQCELRCQGKKFSGRIGPKDGKEVIRLTKKEDVTSQRTQEMIDQVVEDAEDVVLMGSIPCTGVQVVEPGYEERK